MDTLLASIGGLSPRGRGNGPQPARSIPAWAGEPSSWTCDWFLCRVYPHVGGGTSMRVMLRGLSQGLSPRGRGNQIPGWGGLPSSRSIPAWAGEPCQRIPPPYPLPVYPRVGGEPPLCNPPRQLGNATGLSPRGRGNPVNTYAWHVRSRSIPAWAGEPLRQSRRCLG